MIAAIAEYRRWLLRSCLLMLFLLPTARAADILLYLPYAGSALEATAILERDPVFAGRQLTVVGKYRLFIRAVKQDSPAIIYAPSTILDLPGYRLIGQAQRGASTNDHLLWISADPQQSVSHSGTMQVGLLQTMERSQAKTLLAKAFPDIDTPAELRLTAKSEDVFNLLGLELVQACILPSQAVERIESRLGIRLHRIAVSAPIHLPRLWIKQELPEDVVLATWSRLAPSSLELIGIDTVIAVSPSSDKTWLADPPHPEGDP